MIKKGHTYKIGELLKFTYFDGSPHTGKVIKQTYAGDDWNHLQTDYSNPRYTIQVPDDRDARGYMIYPCVGESRIVKRIENNGFLCDDVKSSANKGASTKPLGKKQPKTEQSDLEDAIQKQKDFVGGKVRDK